MGYVPLPLREQMGIDIELVTEFDYLMLPMEMWTDEQLIDAFWDANMFLDDEADEIKLHKEYNELVYPNKLFRSNTKRWTRSTGPK